MRLLLINTGLHISNGGLKHKVGRGDGVICFFAERQIAAVNGVLVSTQARRGSFSIGNYTHRAASR